MDHGQLADLDGPFLKGSRDRGQPPLFLGPNPRVTKVSSAGIAHVSALMQSPSTGNYSDLIVCAGQSVARIDLWEQGQMGRNSVRSRQENRMLIRVGPTVSTPWGRDTAYLKPKSYLRLSSPIHIGSGVQMVTICKDFSGP